MTKNINLEQKLRQVQEKLLYERERVELQQLVQARAISLENENNQLKKLLEQQQETFDAQLARLKKRYKETCLAYDVRLYDAEHQLKGNCFHVEALQNSRDVSSYKEEIEQLRAHLKSKNQLIMDLSMQLQS